MFAAHSVATGTSVDMTVQTMDGEGVLFAGQIFLLSSTSADCGQWVPQTLVVTDTALRISDTMEGCLGLPKRELKLRHVRYAGTEFRHMPVVFGNDSFFDTFASYMKAWLKFTEASPSPRSRLGTGGSTDATGGGGGADSSTAPTTITPSIADRTPPLSVRRGGAAPDMITPERPRILSESYEEESSILQETDLSSLLGLRSLYIVDRHGTCLCFAFRDDEAKEECRGVVWAQLQKCLTQAPIRKCQVRASMPACQ
jgi:hypothetical protein